MSKLEIDRLAYDIANQYHMTGRFESFQRIKDAVRAGIGAYVRLSQGKTELPLREVEVYGWKQRKGDDGILRSVKEVICHAKFHEFGLGSNEAGSYTTAIVEYDDGSLGDVDISIIKFIKPNHSKNH